MPTFSAHSARYRSGIAGVLTCGVHVDGTVVNVSHRRTVVSGLEDHTSVILVWLTSATVNLTVVHYTSTHSGGFISCGLPRVIQVEWVCRRSCLRGFEHCAIIAPPFVRLSDRGWFLLSCRYFSWVMTLKIRQFRQYQYGSCPFKGQYLPARLGVRVASCGTALTLLRQLLLCSRFDCRSPPPAMSRGQNGDIG